jgi:hypothetical protein
MFLLMQTPPPGRYVPPFPADTHSVVFVTANSTSAQTSHITTATTALSVSYWYKGTSSAGGVHIGSVDSTTGYEWYVGQSAAAGTNYPWIALSPDGGSGGSLYDAAGTTAGNLNDGNWHHIVWVYTMGASPTIACWFDGTSVGIYAEGAPLPTALWTGGTQPLTMGCYTNSGSPVPYMTGKIDWTSLYYNYTLTSGDVAALYNGGTPPANINGLASWAHITGFWPLGDGADTTSEYYDLSGNGHNFTVTNGQSFSTDIP